MGNEFANSSVSHICLNFDASPVLSFNQLVAISGKKETVV